MSYAACAAEAAGVAALVSAVDARARAADVVADVEADVADNVLYEFAERVVQILIEMRTPGTAFLDLTL